MKRLAITLLALAAPLPILAAGIPWSNSFDASIAMAKKIHKPLMVFMKVEWSQWCKQMEGEVFASNSIVNLSKSFVPVRLDGDHEGQSVARRYEVRGYPEVLFLDSNGLVIGRSSGLPSAADLTRDMNLALVNLKTFPGYIARIQKNPKDVEALTSLAKIYACRHDFMSAKAMIERCEKADPENKKGFLGSAYNAVGDGLQNMMRFDEALALFQKSGRLQGKPKEVSYAKLSVVACLVALGRNAEAIKELEAVIASPTTPTQDRKNAQQTLDGLKKKS
jgi:tetratricopeptide (TPR) repeat protein